MAKKAKEAATEEGGEKEKTEGEAAPEGGEGSEGAEGGEGGAKKGKQKLIIIAVAGLLVLVGAGLFFSGVLGGGEEGAKTEEHKELTEEEKAAAEKANMPVYYELPQFLVNLNSTSGRASFLKMSVTLELRDAAAVATMDANKPRVVDAFNTYLRELRPADIQGSAGVYRLRVELMSRLNSTIQDGIVKDILFGEIIVQ